MKMTTIGRAVLEAREGVRLEAYRDTKGIWTIGVGHTAACGAPIPGPGVKITGAEADAAFARDLTKFEDAVSAAVKIPLDDHQFDALCSIAFNVGEGWFGAGGHQIATFVKQLNSGDVGGCADHIMDFVVPAEIANRRKAEQEQFCTPYSTALPRPTVTQGRIKGLPAPPPPTPPIIAKPAPPPQGGFSLPAAPVVAQKPKSLWDRLAAGIANLNKGA